MVLKGYLQGTQRALTWYSKGTYRVLKGHSKGTQRALEKGAQRVLEKGTQRVLKGYSKKGTQRVLKKGTPSSGETASGSCGSICEMLLGSARHWQCGTHSEYGNTYRVLTGYSQGTHSQGVLIGCS
jgi:hypothetical protein